MTKTLDQNWIDWESHAFGFGYGTGEPHVISALKRFFELCPESEAYDYARLEEELGASTAWLLINKLCSYDIGMLEYGTSPRYAWLTKRGKALKAYMASKTVDELVELVRQNDEYTRICAPTYCNCTDEDGKGGGRCSNPFWDRDRH